VEDITARFGTDLAWEVGQQVAVVLVEDITAKFGTDLAWEVGQQVAALPVEETVPEVVGPE